MDYAWLMRQKKNTEKPWKIIKKEEDEFIMEENC